MEDTNYISEELLASFLEGTTNSVESIQVLNAIATNDSIANLVSEINTIEDIDIISLRQGDYGYYEFGIDPVFTQEEYLGFLDSKIDLGVQINEYSFIDDDKLLLNTCGAIEEHNISVTDITICNDQGVNKDDTSSPPMEIDTTTMLESPEIDF